MKSAVPLACILSVIRPPSVQYENALLQIAPNNKAKCPFVKDVNDVGFRLYTRHNPTVYQDLVINDDEKLFASNMDFHDNTVIFFHAWMETPDDGSPLMVREAYMQRGDTNVILVNAQYLQSGPWYFTAVQNTWYIGRFAARFIDYLVSRGLNLNNTHLIGHSLGGHSAGVAGNAIQSGRVARLTALDPALPLFGNLPLEQRLDSSDAQFVDIIHTDGGIFGYKAPMGHADFFPNGGISPQPGCELEVVIPQQLLLNNGDGYIRDLYIYCLTDNQDTHLKRKSLESKLQKLFAFIQSVKAKEQKDKENITDKVSLSFEHYPDDTKKGIRAVSKDTKRVESYKEPIVNTNDKQIDYKKTLKTKERSKETERLVKRDIETDEKEEIIEDQIAEASEYDITQIELNPEALEEKESHTITKETTEGQEEINADVTTIGDKTKGKMKTFNKENTRFSLFDAAAENEESIANDIHIENKDNIDTLYYKEPCEPKKVTNYDIENAQKTNSYEVTEKSVEEIPLKYKSQPKINIFNVLENTYRISRVISTLKNHKAKTFTEKLKNLLIFKDKSVKTTATSYTRNLPLLREQDSATRTKNHVVKRQKRFLPFFRRNEEPESNNILFKMLDFLIKNRRNVLPVFTVMREINTLVKSGNGELNHFTKEQNNYIGATPPTFTPITYNLELGNENRAVAFIKRLLGMNPKGDRLTINGRK